MSCDQAGVLSASNEAISPEESFLCIQANDLMGTFNIQTQREKYLAIARGTRGPEVRGDADSISSDAIFRIRMHARFRSRLKASKESKGQERITKKELEAVVGRKLEDEELRKLKKARAQGDYHEAILDVRVKGKHDKYA